MSLPPLSQLANLIKTTPLASQITPLANTPAPDTALSKAASQPTVSLQALITQLKITTPTTLEAKVVASGLLPSESTTKHTIPFAQKPTTSPNLAVTAATQWSKVRIANTLNLLLTYPKTNTAKATPANTPLSTIGSTVTITVTPNGSVSVIPQSPNPQTASTGYNLKPNNDVPPPLQSRHHSSIAILNNTPSPYQANRQSGGHSNASIQPTVSALTKLASTLNTQQPNNTSAQPISHLLNKTLTIIHSLKPLSPAISQQLLPNKLLNTLITPTNTNPLQLSLNNKTPQGTSLPIKAPQTPITQLIELTKESIKDSKSQTIPWLQQSLSLSLHLVGNNNNNNNTHPAKPNNTDLFSALLSSLPSQKGASATQISESRQTIARWLNQELTAQITRTASTQIQNHTQNIERPNEWQQQIEIPLRWGDEFGAVQVRIEQKEEKSTNAKNGTQNEKDQQWEIAMDFELPTPANSSTGPIEIQSMSAHLKLQQSNLSVAFWSQDIKLNKQIEASLGPLKQQLLDAGLSITELSCHQGAPPAKPKTLQQTLIDIKT